MTLEKKHMESASQKPATTAIAANHRLQLVTSHTHCHHQQITSCTAWCSQPSFAGLEDLPAVPIAGSLRQTYPDWQEEPQLAGQG